MKNIIAYNILSAMKSLLFTKFSFLKSIYKISFANNNLKKFFM